MAEAVSETSSDRQVGTSSTIRPHLSVSQLKMYLRCPLQYFFRYVCGLKSPPTGDLTLGRTIHQTLNDNYKQKMETGHDIIIDHISELFSDGTITPEMALVEAAKILRKTKQLETNPNFSTQSWLQLEA